MKTFLNFGFIILLTYSISTISNKPFPVDSAGLEKFFQPVGQAMQDKLFGVLGSSGEFWGVLGSTGEFWGVLGTVNLISSEAFWRSGINHTQITLFSNSTEPVTPRGTR